MKIINNINGIKANGHYAPAVLSHGLLFVSGQLPMVNGKVVEGGIEAQAKQSLANIDKILVAAGMPLTTFTRHISAVIRRPASSYRRTNCTTAPASRSKSLRRCRSKASAF